MNRNVDRDLPRRPQPPASPLFSHSRHDGNKGELPEEGSVLEGAGQCPWGRGVDGTTPYGGPGIVLQ